MKCEAVSDDRTSGVGAEDGGASVVGQGGSEVPARGSARGPGGADGWFEMDQYFGSRWGEWGSIEVEGSKEVMVRGEVRVTCGGSKEVKGKCGLVEKCWPMSEGEGRVDGREAGNEVILEGLDRTLSCIATMYIWWDELKG